jgi:hypothetical protein
LAVLLRSETFNATELRFENWSILQQVPGTQVTVTGTSGSVISLTTSTREIWLVHYTMDLDTVFVVAPPGVDSTTVSLFLDSGATSIVDQKKFSISNGGFINSMANVVYLEVNTNAQLVVTLNISYFNSVGGDQVMDLILTQVSGPVTPP